MDLVLFCHPSFLSSQSMPRFARMLKTSYEARGHRVELWSPRSKVSKRIPRGRFSKWAGYIDQYILFPIWARKATRRVSSNTLFVFCDQALGPWVPLVKDRPHVVHVHDLLALRSALGDIPENPTSVTAAFTSAIFAADFSRAATLFQYQTKHARTCIGSVVSALRYPKSSTTE